MPLVQKHQIPEEVAEDVAQVHIEALVVAAVVAREHVVG